MPLLPSGPGGVHAPAHAWHLADADHATESAGRNFYFTPKSLTLTASRPISRTAPNHVSGPGWPILITKLAAHAVRSFAESFSHVFEPQALLGR